MKDNTITQEYLENLIAMQMDMYADFIRWSKSNGNKALDMLKQHETDFEEIVKVLRTK